MSSYDELRPPNPFTQQGRHRFVGIEQWQTISFTALTDWVNVYCSDHDSDMPTRDKFWCSDCPGVLLQESTEIVWHWDEPGEDEHRYPRHSGSVEHDRITRAVFAAPGDYGGPLEEAGCHHTCTRTAYREWISNLEFKEKWG